jgi:ribosomal protein S10
MYFIEASMAATIRIRKILAERASAITRAGIFPRGNAASIERYELRTHKAIIATAPNAVSISIVSGQSSWVVS